jgi:hypothetical protein
MSDTYWFSDVLECVYQLKKVNDKSFDLIDVTTGNETSILTEEFDKFGFSEIPEEDLGMILLQVAGEGDIHSIFRNMYEKMAALVDSDDMSGAGHWARQLFKLQKEKGCKSPPGMQSLYLTPQRLDKVINHSKNEHEAKQAAAEAKRKKKYGWGTW